MKDFLDYLKLPKIVWISEDGTGIVPKIEHDPHTNQLIGLVLPLDSKSGIPKAYTYLANSAESIQKFSEHEKSTHVYMVLAQPLVDGAPPFILQIFGIFGGW